MMRDMDIMERSQTISAEADLVFIGIPNIKPGQEASFVQRTNDLVGIIGTTLLVKASSTFETTELGLKDMEHKQDYEPDERHELPALAKIEEEEMARLAQNLDEELSAAAAKFCESAPSILQQHYQQWITDQKEILTDLLGELEKDPGRNFQILQEYLSRLMQLSQHFQEEELEVLERILSEGIDDYRKLRDDIIAGIPATITISRKDKPNKKTKVHLREALTILHETEGDKNLLGALHRMGAANANLILKSAKMVRELYRRLSLGISSPEPWQTTLSEAETQLEAAFSQLEELSSELVEAPGYELRYADRKICNRVIAKAGWPTFRKELNNEKKSFNQRALKNTSQEIRQYDQYWSRNQSLFHRNFDGSLQLTQVSLQLNKCKEKAILQLKKGFIDQVMNNIRQLQNAVADIRQTLQEEGENDWENRQLYQEEDYDNIDAVLWRFMKSVEMLGQQLPAELELMDEESRNNFRQEQSLKVNTIKLALAEIVTYLIDHHFSSPFQKQLLQLRQQLNQVSGRVNNHGSLLNYGLEAVHDEKGTEELSSILNKAAEELEKLADAATNIFRSAEAEIKEKYEATDSLLSIDNMVIRSEELSQYVRKESRRRGLAAWRTWAEQGTKAFQQELAAFINRKQEEVAMANFEQAHFELRSDPDRLRSYSEALLPETAVESLPFYYRQLFSGKHLNLGQKTASREREIRKMEKAIHHLKNGEEGAIMITGEPLSGKSYFLEYTARQLFSVPSYRILPPPGGSMAPRALQSVFEQAIGKRGSIDQLLEQLPEKSLFLLEDIELWWLKQEEGGRPINALIDISKKFSHRHFFLMTASLDALQWLRRYTAIDAALLKTIILSPFSPEHLKKILWARHKTGGIPLTINDKAEQELTGKEWQQIVDRLHEASKGNVGAALSKWLTQIEMDDQEAFYLETDMDIPDFPELRDASWYFVLMQLYLHKALSRRRFYRLFEPEGTDWVDQRISALGKANFLKPHGRDIVELHPFIRQQVGHLLKERGLL